MGRYRGLGLAHQPSAQRRGGKKPVRIPTKAATNSNLIAATIPI
jgi:hypothetical protein